MFDYSYPEVAAIIGKSEANCRQMVHRAQQHLKERRPRFEVSREQQERVTQRFLEVCAGGDMQGLLNMLAPEVTLTSDGGGKVQAARNVLHGPVNVARFLFGVLGKLPSSADLTTRMTEVNDQPGVLLYIDGAPNSVISLGCSDGHVVSINIVVNPDKLSALT